jgi:hypothetical protein
MVHASIILAFFMATGHAQKAPPSFKASIRLPVDLYSKDGTHVEKGQYDVIVKQENSQYSLVLLQKDQPKITIAGSAAADSADDHNSLRPLIGTQYLRSSEDPVGTEAERHFSKTGLPQYQEENRDWKASLRVYATSDGKDALWIFEQRLPGYQWSHIKFKLYLTPP